VLYRAIESPKRSGARREADFYYYYAAFGQAFVQKKILELNLSRPSLILDPWCGSGTTLEAAHRLGHHSLGCDINPVSVVLSKSRFASAHDINVVIDRLGKAIDRLATVPGGARKPNVVLWTLRQNLLRHAESWSPEKYDSWEPRIALLFATLFFFAKKAVGSAPSKNPSWRNKNNVPHLSVQQLRQNFEILKVLLDRRKETMQISYPSRSARVTLINNEVEPISRTPLADAVITSPPYLTRLDYGISSGLEWRLLQTNPAADFATWRSSFTGSVLTNRSPVSNRPLPRSISDLLRCIHRHPSKAAQTYYFRFFRNYFVGIQNSLENISSSCREGAQGLFVLQDSCFKDVEVALTELFCDMLQNCGWVVEKIEPFSIAPTFYKINSRRWAIGSPTPTENLIWATRVSKC
jgi:DNA methylase